MSDLEQLERNADYNLGFDDGLAIGRSEAADRLRQYREALEAIVEACANEGYGNPIVNDRIVDRCDDFARQALKETTDVD